ncbi:MAG: HAD-IA family hydrolase, partial [Pseudomonadota bacterium]
DVVVAGDDLPKRKPDPMQLTHAMAQLGVADCVYVGDSETDAATAENAAMPFVLYTEGIRHTPVSEMRHAAVFSDFADLADVLATLP